MVRYGSKPPDMCIQLIRRCAQNMLTILVNIIVGDLHDHLMSTRFFAYESDIHKSSGITIELELATDMIGFANHHLALIAGFLSYEQCTEGASVHILLCTEGALDNLPPMETGVRWTKPGECHLCMPYMVTLLNQTPVIQWYMARLC